MIRSVLTTLSMALLLAVVPAVARAQVTPGQTAEEENVRRQEQAIVLRRTLKDAQSDQKAGDLGSAAKTYELAWGLVESIGDAGIEQERQETVAGFTQVYLTLAKKSYARQQYTEAKNQLTRVLKVDPKNPEGLKEMALVDKTLKELQGRMPSKETLAQLPEVEKQHIATGTLVQDGKLLYEMGKLDEAEAKLRQAAKQEPNNPAAFYYLKLIEEARYSREARKREYAAKAKLIEVENAWNPPPKYGNLTNLANPIARTNSIYTGEGRHDINEKLNHIVLQDVEFPDIGVPLSEAVKYLDKETRLRDPQRQGLNFMIAPWVDIQTQTQGALTIDPTTGQPSTAPPEPPFELRDVKIRIEPALRNVTLKEVLDAIVKVAEKPIKFSIEDYAIIFSRKLPEQQQLFTRTYKVNPNTFQQGLEGVSGFDFESAVNTVAGGNGTTGGTSGGGGYGGGGGGGGMGGGGMGGGMGGGGNSSGGAIIPRVYVSGGGMMGGMGGGMGGMGGGMGGMGGGMGGMMGGMGGGMGGMGGGMGGMGGGMGGGGGGLTGVTSMTQMSYVNMMARMYFTAAGVDLGGQNLFGQGGFGAGGGGGFGQAGAAGAGFQNAQGKALFFNDRTGILLVRATLQDLDIIDQAIQTLNRTPDQVTIEAKFVEIGQEDSKALGFNWFLGNMNMFGGNVGAQGGTAPSYSGNPSAANPYGTFPGTFGVPSQTPNSTTDQLLTGGLRQSQAGSTAIPAVGTITGIMTDPQFRVVINALEQRSGTDILSAPKVTTVSGRQAQIQIIELQNIVVYNSANALGGTGVGAVTGTTGTGTVTSDRNVKAGFESVDTQTILEQVAGLPITRWHYTNDPVTPHVGPMAQDFKAIFNLGHDDKSIAIVDEGGVALAAIQGLNQKLEQQIKARDAEIQDLKQSVAELKKLVQSLAEKK